MNNINKSIEISSYAIDLLEKAKKQITDHPESYWQANYCGSIRCICCWLCFFAAIPDEWNVSKVINKLQLTTKQFYSLYNLYDWPESFRANYQFATTEVERGKAACERIDHFIKTDGNQ